MPNLAALLIDHPFPDDRGLLYTVDRAVVAGAARDAARAVAEQLWAGGLQPGRAVTVQLPNGPDAVTAMVGVWLAGGVFVPVNPRAPDPEVARMTELTQPAAAVTPDGVATLGAGRRYEPGTALVLWTSGTTGTPKPILHRHDAYLELLDRVLDPLRSGGGREPARAPTPNLIPVSLALNAGIYNTLFGLRAGAAIVIMDGFDTAVFAELVGRFEIRSTVLPPGAITMLNDDDAVRDLAPLTYVRSITAPLSPRQARRFTDKFGAVVLNGYGQAELGEVIGWTARDAREHPDRVGAVGRPHPGVAIRLVDADPDGAGRLFVRPPSRAIGDAGGDALDDRTDQDGYVDTGDIARIDDAGFVWIEGRAGEVINRGGNKVYPGDVEEVLRLSPAVSDAAVVGVSDRRLGEVPVAFVTGDAVDPVALEALCRRHLVPYKVPVAFHAVDTLPRNETGKLLRAPLAERHAELTSGSGESRPGRSRDPRPRDPDRRR